MAKHLLIPLDGRTRQSNNFDFIRLSMASLVLWSHSFALWYGTEGQEPLSLALNGNCNSGNVGVMVFFIVSGFLKRIPVILKHSLHGRNSWRILED